MSLIKIWKCQLKVWPWFWWADYSTGGVLQQKRHGYPQSLLEHEVSAHPSLSEGCMTAYGMIVRKWRIKEHWHLGSGSTAEEFWIGFIWQQTANAVLAEVETHDRTFSLLLWPSLPISAPSVAFAVAVGYIIQECIVGIQSAGYKWMDDAL